MQHERPLSDWDEVRQPVLAAALLEQWEAEERAIHAYQERSASEVHIVGESLSAYSLHPSWTWTKDRAS